MNSDELVEKLESLIRQGLGSEAKTLIEDMDATERRKIPPHRLAAFYRRTNDPLIGCRLLFSMLNETAKSDHDPRLLAEYGVCLTDIGCFTEGTRILESIDPLKVPSALFYLALKDFKLWHYHDALKKLTKYIELETNEYPRMIGLLNMVSCHMSREEFDLAIEKIQLVEAYARENSYNLMLGNVLEQKAYVAFMYFKNQKEALKHLDSSIALLKRSKTRGYLYSAKWKLIFALKEGHARKALAPEIKKFCEMALEMQDWESLRDIDRHLAVTFSDGSLFDRVYFGTPYLAFREKMKKMLPEHSLPSSYTFKLSGEAKNTLNLLGGALSGSKVSLPKNSLRLLQTLTSDFYSRLNVGAVHERQYPDEHFNPFSGPLRVHQAILRLRKHLSEAAIGIEVLHEDGGYGWELQDPKLGLLIPREMVEGGALVKKMNPKLAKLKLIVGSNTFSVDEAARALAVSTRTVYRLVSEASEVGILKESAEDSSDRKYRFVA